MSLASNNPKALMVGALFSLMAIGMTGCGAFTTEEPASGSDTPAVTDATPVIDAPTVVPVTIPQPNDTAVALSQEDQQRAILSARNVNDDQYDMGGCFLPAGSDMQTFTDNGCLSDLGSASFDIVLFGDNTAAQYSQAVRDIAEANEWGFSQLTLAGCPPLLETSRDDACKAHVEAAVATLEAAEGTDLIIMGGRLFDASNTRIWAGRTAERLAASGAQIVILGPHARFNASLPELLNDAGLSPGLNLASVLSELSETTFTHDDAFATDMVDMQGTYFTFGDDVAYVSTTRTLCPNGAGTCKVFVGNAPMLSNAVMLTPEGAKWMVAEMAPSLFPETR